MKYGFNRFFLMGAYFLFTSLFLFSNNSNATTSKDTLYYMGKVHVSKRVSYAYAIRFVIQEDNTINGYTITDAGGLYETKTKIKGNYDSVKKSISFEEYKVLRSRVDTGKTDLCFINATLFFKQDKLFEKLVGKFNGNKPKSKGKCGGGEINLINTKPVKSVIDKSENVEDKKRVQVIDSKERNSKEIVKVDDDRPKSFLFSENDVTITIWDNGIVDNDRISLIADGRYILRDYVLDSVKKVIHYKIPEKEMDVRMLVVALNEGEEPPNTAMVIIESASDKYVVEIRAKKNESRVIYLAKRKNTNK